MYTELMKCNQDSDFAIDWSCRVCRSTKSDLKGISSTLQELKSTSEARLIRVEDRLSSLETSMKDTVVEEVEKVRSSLSTTLSGNIAKQVNDLVESRVKEIEDRKNRAQNIVIFKLALCESSDKLERKEYDMQVVKDLFSSICPDQGDLQVKACFRLFNKDKPTSAAPLKVVMGSKEQRRNMLLNSKNISDLHDSILSKLIIVRDLTASQRKETKAINDEKKRRIDNGENIALRNGEIIELPVSQATGHSFQG